MLSEKARVMVRTVWTATAVMALILVAISDAQVQLQGYFIAFQACEANKKKTSDNPGDIRLEPMHAYKMLGRNSTPGTHYQITVTGAPVTEARWVPMTCGAFAPQEALVVSGDGPPSDGGTGPFAANSIENVLAASWQPGFCATERGQGKTECQSQTAERPDARQFSIHGLWPDDLDDRDLFPCYCNGERPSSCRQSQAAVSSIDLSDHVRDRLQVLMPGFASTLHLHEWTKHGTCYEDDRTEDTGADPDEYFGDVMALIEQLNRSAVRDLFAAHLGQVLTFEHVAQAFQEAFGDGAGERFQMMCAQHHRSHEDVITELWISLTGNIRPDTDLGGLILASPPREVSSGQRPCARGLVVRVEN